jgi:hypothetical protein
MGYEPQFVLGCPCGATLTGDTEDDIVSVVTAHLAAEHPERLGHYDRDQILFMAKRLVK